jgi:hypothetical protein
VSAQALHKLTAHLSVAVLVGLFAAGASTGCLGADGHDAKGKSCIETWNADVQPIANDHCVVCHQKGTPSGGLSLQPGDAPASLLNVSSTETNLARVQPGKPAKSYLFYKISGTHLTVGGSGDRMPLGGELMESEIAAIKKWIEACREPIKTR